MPDARLLTIKQLLDLWLSEAKRLGVKPDQLRLEPGAPASVTTRTTMTYAEVAL